MTPILLPRAVCMSPRERRMRELEGIRDSLPVNQYLTVLHSAAMTGQLPQFRHIGNDPRKPVEFTGEFRPITPEMQVKIASYLVDKAMPDKPPEGATETPALAEVAPDPKRMTREQLLAMLTSAVALPDPSKPTATTAETEHADANL